MVATLRSIADSAWFQNFVTIVIVLAGILVGIETYEHIAEAHHTLLHTLDKIILGIFILEIVVKMGAEGSKPWRYFLDPWNVFDFTIVAAAFIPGMGQYAVVLRLLRLLRVLKLVRALPKLQVLVGALLKSIPSMFYVSLLLFMLFYVYAVAAVFLFGQNDPLHFENLNVSLLTLFRVVTLEDWTDIMYIQMFGCEAYNLEMSQDILCTEPQPQYWLSVAFFVSFVLLGTMVILNLFIGVIMSGMDEARLETEEGNESARQKEQGLEPGEESVEHEFFELQQQLEKLQEQLGIVQMKMIARLGETNTELPPTLRGNSPL